MPNFNPSLFTYGAILIAANTAAIAVLPRTAGFTKLLPTSLCLAGFFVTAWALARLVHSGIQLSILMPLAAAAIPLAAVFVGVFYYGEPASPLKIGILITACLLIGVAARA